MDFLGVGEKGLYQGRRPSKISSKGIFGNWNVRSAIGGDGRGDGGRDGRVD
jgi:hypothetical protein